MQKGDVYLADLSPVVGSEQPGVRPIVIGQNSALNRVARTSVIVPFTTNLRRASVPTGVLIPKGEGGLNQDSVALCHQIRVLDKSRLTAQIGRLANQWIEKIDETLAYVLDL